MAEHQGHIVQEYLQRLKGGIRLCDVRRLSWKNISNRQVTFKQTKSGVNTVPLNANALKQLGKEKEGPLFDLPRSHSQVNVIIKNWVKAAKIKKHVTVHVFRHSNITNIGKRKGLHVASKIAGHTTVGMTDRYTHLIDKDRREAVDSLPEL